MPFTHKISLGFHFLFQRYSLDVVDYENTWIFAEKSLEHILVSFWNFFYCLREIEQGLILILIKTNSNIHKSYQILKTMLSFWVRRILYSKIDCQSIQLNQFNHFPIKIWIFSICYKYSENWEDRSSIGSVIQRIAFKMLKSLIILLATSLTICYSVPSQPDWKSKFAGYKGISDSILTIYQKFTSQIIETKCFGWNCSIFNYIYSILMMKFHFVRWLQLWQIVKTTTPHHRMILWIFSIWNHCYGQQIIQIMMQDIWCSLCCPQSQFGSNYRRKKKMIRRPSMSPSTVSIYLQISFVRKTNLFYFVFFSKNRTNFWKRTIWWNTCFRRRFDRGHWNIQNNKTHSQEVSEQSLYWIWKW